MKKTNKAESSAATRRAPILAIAAAWFAIASSAAAHHSYAMFDGTRTLSVTGTVAKLEWMNPHVFVWVHVPNPKAPGGYDLYAFENGSPHVLAQHGWTKVTLQSGEKIIVEYWPLKDGRHGGHFLRAIHADGRVSLGAGGPNAATSGSIAPGPQQGKQGPRQP
jgi:hypothetical protein